MRATVPTTRKTGRIAAALLVMAAALPAPASWAQGANEATKEIAAYPEDAAYWLRNREGWFWYHDPPAAARRPSPPAPKPPRELVEFEAMQKRLEDLKRVAVMNPTDANLTAYMRYQRMVMNKSEHFAERWQRLVWTVPDLDYGLTGRPTNALAFNVFDEQQRDRDRRAEQVPPGRLLLLDEPQPQQRYRDVDTAVGCVGAGRAGRVEGQEPDKGRKAQGCGDQQPRGAPLPEPEVGKVAAEDLGDRRESEQHARAEQRHTHPRLRPGVRAAPFIRSGRFVWGRLTALSRVATEQIRSRRQRFPASNEPAPSAAYRAALCSQPSCLRPLSFGAGLWVRGGLAGGWWDRGPRG